jgi:hypothetical protein
MYPSGTTKLKMIMKPMDKTGVEPKGELPTPFHQKVSENMNREGNGTRSCNTNKSWCQRKLKSARATLKKKT